jgi:hypothetical protein
MIICNSKKIPICKDSNELTAFLQAIKQKPSEFCQPSTENNEQKSLPSIIFPLSIISKYTDDKGSNGTLFPENHTGESLHKMAIEICKTYPAEGIEKFWVLDTSLLQISRYFLYTFANKILEKTDSVKEIELKSHLDQNQNLNVGNIFQLTAKAKEQAKAEIIAELNNGGRNKIEENALKMANEVSEKWRSDPENKRAFDVFKKHFGDKYRLISWHEAIDQSKEDFNSRVQFLKELWKKNGKIDNLNAKIRTSVNIHSIGKRFKHAVDDVIVIFYELIPEIIKELLDHNLIKEKLREILFAECALRTLLPFHIEIYPGLPNSAEEMAFYLFKEDSKDSKSSAITTPYTPYIIGTEDNIKTWCIEISRRNGVEIFAQKDCDNTKSDESKKNRRSLSNTCNSINTYKGSPSRSASWPPDNRTLTFFRSKEEKIDADNNNNKVEITIITVKCNSENVTNIINSILQRDNKQNSIDKSLNSNIMLCGTRAAP